MIKRTQEELMQVSLPEIAQILDEIRTQIITVDSNLGLGGVLYDLDEIERLPQGIKAVRNHLRRSISEVDGMIKELLLEDFLYGEERI